MLALEPQLLNVSSCALVTGVPFSRRISLSPVFRKFMVTVSSILLGVASGLWLKARFKESGMWMVPPREKILT